MNTSTPKVFDDVFMSVVAENIMSYLSLTDLIALQTTCQSLRRAVESRLGHRFNINVFLKDFIQDIEAFRYQLGKSDALIVRGAALNFLETQHRQFKYLNLLVEDGSKANSLTNYLCAEESYIAPPHLQGLLPRQTERTFALSSSGLQPKETIRITATRSSPIRALLKNCLMTAELNFITWNKAYCLFPAATLLRHKSYPLRVDDLFINLLEEFACQGWTLDDVLWLESRTPKPCGIGSRRVGDACSVSIPVAPPMDSSGMTPNYVIEDAAFDIPVDGTGLMKKATPKLRVMKCRCM